MCIRDSLRAATTRKSLQAEKLRPDTAIQKGDPFYGSYHLSNQIERQIAAQLGSNIARAAFELPLNNWSKHIESPYGYHLIWIEQRTSALEPPLTEVQDDIVSRIRRLSRDAGFQKLMTKIRDDYQIEIEQGAIENS